MVNHTHRTRAPAAWLAAGTTLLALAGCQQTGDPAGPTGARASAASSPPLALAPRSQWQRLGPSTGPWLVSPRFGPEGERILLSGLKGKGLYLAGSNGELQPLSPSYRGPAAIAPDGRSLCLPNLSGDPEPGQALPLGLRLAPADACDLVRHDPELGDILYDGPAGRWIHHPLSGELRWEQPGGNFVLVDDRGPWAIRISPDGRRVAYSLGVLPDSRLYLWDDAQGLRELGPGIYPAFHPDGVLIYSRPSGQEMMGSVTTVAQADLHALDLETGRSWPLTDTPDVAEMEVDISPDGAHLAFADWSGGGAYRVAFREREVR